MSQVSSTKKLVSASAIMASGTLVSRVLGMLRVVLIVYILGTGSRQADMFELANTVPNSIYILFAGGALNTVLVPQIVRAIKKDPDGGEAYTNRIMTAFMLIVGVVALGVTIAAPVVTSIYSSSSWRAPELASQYASLVALAYLTLPQIFFYGAFFLLGQVLNARDKFGPMMWAPIANNVVSIAVLALYLVIWGNDVDTSLAFTTGQIWMLGAGSTLGIAVQTAVLIPYVRKAGFKIRPRFDLLHTGLGKTFKLAGWTLGFVGVNQLTLIVVQRLATSATAVTGHGAGLNVYNNAHLLWILPHSLITVSLATAMLPNASRLASSGDKAGVVAEFTKTTRLALIVIVPAAVTFLALAGPISAILFGIGPRGSDAILIAWTLMAFAVGLIPFTIQFVCLRTYYALEDTRTPFFLQILIAGVNMLAAVGLVALTTSTDWVAPALGLAYSLAYLVGVLVSWQLLARRLPGLGGGKMLLHLIRLLIGSAVGGVAAYFLSGWITDLIGVRLVGDIVACVVGGLLILGSYLLVGKLLKVRELGNLSELVRSRFGRGKSSAASVTGPDITDDQATIMLPAFVDDTSNRPADDFDDIGPVTIVRNRPPISRHTFDTPPTVTTPAAEAPPTQPMAAIDPEVDDVHDAIFRRPGSAAPAPSIDEDADEESTGGIDEESTDGISEESTAENFADLPTGPIEISEIFRESSSPRRVHPSHIATVGTLLNTRYELVELLAQRHGTESWRAHDQVLSRDVIVHVIAPGDDRISELMTAARKGAVATDSRFLRVLDADEVTDPTQGIGAYVVAEYANGRSLTELLAKGPLSAIEAAFIVRELADALVAVHGQGLFHEQLNPDNVIITSSGAVRMVGFGTEATLAGDALESNAWAVRERSDVVGLGNLLYATLVRHWPGGSDFGLPAAPIVAGETAAPHSVQAGISPALDRVCSTTLTQRGAMSERRITTAAQLVTALNQVLGTADASADLEQRVRAWDSLRDAPVPPTSVDEHSGQLSLAAPSKGTPVRQQSPDPIVREESTGRSRRVLWLLIALAVVALVVSLIIVGVNSAKDNAAGPSPTGSPSVTAGQSPSGPAAITIVGAKDFDPDTDGGNSEEFPELTKNVLDGDPKTSWKTMSYKNRPNLGGLKPGVGVILDLGEVRKVSSVELLMTGGETSVELRVPKGEEPSMRTEADWSIVGANDAAKGTVTMKLDKPVETRYVMVYLTKLPKVGDRYIGEINEITVS